MSGCLSSSVAYVHIGSDRYFQVKPKAPYVYIYSYLQEIPDPVYKIENGNDIADYIIGLFFLLIFVFGTITSMWKLKLFDVMCGSVAKYRRKKSFSKISTLEGAGFSDESTSKLPIRRLFGGIIPGSDGVLGNDYGLVSTAIDVSDDEMAVREHIHEKEYELATIQWDANNIANGSNIAGLKPSFKPIDATIDEVSVMNTTTNFVKALESTAEK